jgi:hypothetical protein
MNKLHITKRKVNTLQLESLEEINLSSVGYSEDKYEDFVEIELGNFWSGSDLIPINHLKGILEKIETEGGTHVTIEYNTDGENDLTVVGYEYKVATEEDVLYHIKQLERKREYNEKLKDLYAKIKLINDEYLEV